MRELGQFLRTKRESLGLSLDEVQERTKIRKRYLVALENGDWNVLPGYVYGRGFVRSYAEVLGLDGLELLQEYMDVSLDGNDDEVHVKSKKSEKAASKDNRVTAEEQKPVTRNRTASHEQYRENEVKPAYTTSPKKNKVAKASRERVPSPATRLLSGRKFNTISQVAVVVGVLAIIGGSLYMLNRDKGQVSPPGGNAVASGSIQNRTSGTDTNATGNNVSSQANVSNTASGNTANTSGDAGQSKTTGTTSIIPAAFQNNAQNYTVVTADPLSVSLTATTGSCWVKVTADNSIIDGSDMINQGIKKSWSANQTLTIRVGNVSAVQLEVNGQPVTLPQTTNAIDITFVKQQPQAQ